MVYRLVNQTLKKESAKWGEGKLWRITTHGKQTKSGTAMGEK